MGPEFAEGKSCIGYCPGQKNLRDLDRPDLRDVPLAERLAMPALLGRARSREDAALLMAAALGLTEQTPFRFVDTPAGQVVLRRELVPHLVEKEADARERYAPLVIPTLERPWETWLTEYTDGTFRPQFIGLSEGKMSLLVIIREARDGALV